MLMTNKTALFLLWRPGGCGLQKHRYSVKCYFGIVSFCLTQAAPRFSLAEPSPAHIPTAGERACWCEPLCSHSGMKGVKRRLKRDEVQVLFDLQPTSYAEMLYGSGVIFDVQLRTTSAMSGQLMHTNKSC